MVENVVGINLKFRS